VLHDNNRQQSFETLPLKPNGQSKNMGALDRIPPDPATSRLESPNGASTEPSGTRHIRQIDEDRHRQICILAREEI
jgi:hypothetical protein